jgi:hypothetical protein
MKKSALAADLAAHAVECLRGLGDGEGTLWFQNWTFTRIEARYGAKISLSDHWPPYCARG